MVEDADGAAAPLNLYNFVPPALDPQQFLPEGSFLAILAPCVAVPFSSRKPPLLSCCCARGCSFSPRLHVYGSKGTHCARARSVPCRRYLRHPRDDPSKPPVLRCDNPQAVVVFPDELSWRRAAAAAAAGSAAPAAASAAAAAEAEAEEEWDEEAVLSRCAELCSRGLAEAACRAFDAAAARAPAPSARVLAESALLRLRLERWEAAVDLADAALRCGGGADADTAAAAARAVAMLVRADALLCLGRRAEAQDAAWALIADKAACGAAPEAAAEAESIRAQALQSERESRGEYDVEAMREEAAASPSGRLSRRHGDYWSPLAGVRTATEGAGRGVEARAALPAGTLVLAAKALVAFDSEDAVPGPSRVAAVDAPISPGAKGFISRGSHVESVAALARRLAARPAFGEELYFLSGGGAWDAHPLEDKSRVDVRRIHSMLHTNGFGLQGGGSGLWGRPSLLNHSCLPNCSYEIIGDFMFVYTTRDIAAGEEARNAFSQCAASRCIPRPQPSRLQRCSQGQRYF